MPLDITPQQLAALSPQQLKTVEWRLGFYHRARANQMEPKGDWLTWGIMAGRGFGKTFAGANWIAGEALANPNTIGHVVAPTWDDVKSVCFEGPAGLIKSIPPELIAENGYNRSDLALKLWNGSMLRGFSAEKPDRLRGPQCHYAWCDELAAWQYAQETWDMLQMGLRLGQRPRVVFTTTPRPIPLVQDLVRDKRCVITSGSTHDNRANLAPTFFDQIMKYNGTQLGRQEIYGELIDPEESGIIKRQWFRLWPANKPLPKLSFVVMSLDTAFTERTRDKKTGDADPTACTVWGLFEHDKRKHVMLLDCWQDWLSMPDLITRVRSEMKVEYGEVDAPIIKPMLGPAMVRGSGKKIDLLLIEDKGSGISLRQMLEREGVLSHAYNPGNADKLSRLHAVSHMPASGLIWLPESQKTSGAPRTWAEPLLAQLCVFTGEGSTRHDDFVDSTTQAWRLIADKNLLSVTGYKPEKPDPGPPAKPKLNPYAV